MKGSKEQAMERENNFSLRELKHWKRHEGVKNDDAFTPIKKQEEHDKKLNDIRDNIEMLNQVTSSNSISIQ